MTAGVVPGCEQCDPQAIRRTLGRVFGPETKINSDSFITLSSQTCPGSPLVPPHIRAGCDQTAVQLLHTPEQMTMLNSDTYNLSFRVTHELGLLRSMFGGSFSETPHSLSSGTFARQKLARQRRRAHVGSAWAVASLLSLRQAWDCTVGSDAGALAGEGRGRGRFGGCFDGLDGLS